MARARFRKCPVFVSLRIGVFAGLRAEMLRPRPAVPRDKQNMIRDAIIGNLLVVQWWHGCHDGHNGHGSNVLALASHRLTLC